MTTYRLWPATSGGAVANDNSKLTLGCQFTVSQACTLHAIWWWTPSTADVLPSATAIYLKTGTGTGSVVAGTQNNSPSWSGSAGANAWVSVAYSDTVLLLPGNSYKVVVLLPGDAGSAQYGSTSLYWSSGSGSAGIISGPLTAVNNAAGDGGQDTFNSGAALTYPDSAFNASNYWVDVEVTPIQVPAMPSNPGRTWRRQFHHTQQLVNAPAAVSVNAGVAAVAAAVTGATVAGTAAAGAPAIAAAAPATTAADGASAAAGAVAGAAPGAAVADTATAAASAVTAAAAAPSATAAAPAAAAAAAAAAPAALPAVTTSPAAAVVTAGAPAAVAGSGDIATAGSAAVVAAGIPPVAALQVLAAAASVTTAAAPPSLLHTAVSLAAAVAVAAAAATGGEVVTPFTIGVLQAGDSSSATLTASTDTAP